ncbi:MAG: FkbM family methyltransferase [Candidatus Acidiferrales bacterium]
MPRAKKWVGDLLLHSPAPLRSLRDLPLVGNLIHRLSHRLVPADQLVWARVEAGPAKGLWLELNPRTGQAYVRGEAEQAVQAVIAKRLRPGMVFYDLGANVGLFTLLAARLVGETGKVFSFEPDPENVARLRRNIERNGFRNVTVVESGIWSSSGTLRFVASVAGSPDHGFGKFVENGPEREGALASCVALDDFARTAPPPDAIKCDIEGAEIAALRGAAALLQSPRRPWIICEMHSPANDRAAREILAGYGYQLETADELHVLALPAKE